MRIPRTRGAVSGLLLVILGAWGALVPFIGPYFDLVIGSDQSWDWSSGRFWLSVLPGVVTFLGGVLLLTSAHRARAGVGAWMAIAAGAWFVVGPTVSMLWNDGQSAAGEPAGGINQRVLELLTMFSGLGAVIVALGAFALGRLAVRSVRDAELARAAEVEREREQRLGEPTPAPAAGAGDRSAGDADADVGLGDDRTPSRVSQTGAAARPPRQRTQTQRRGGVLKRLRRP